MNDNEKNRFSARAARYARVGANVGGVAARIAGARLFGLTLDRGRNAMELAAALGGLKGPIMKVAQLMATIPDALPPEYAAELTKLARAARHAAGLGLHVHAGHGLNYHNVQAVVAIEEIEELNIGHSIVSRAILVGMERAVRDMKEAILRATGK